MPCYHPMPAWRDTDGSIQLTHPPHDEQKFLLPCAHCLGCAQSRSQGWALRCELEYHQHRSAAFTTLTYADEALPPFHSLDYDHVQQFLKRLRGKLTRSKPKRTLRFFASGEYGETTSRPHYHAILYGIDSRDSDLVQDTWNTPTPMGLVHTVDATSATIAYVAGYVDKKARFRERNKQTVDKETGELLHEWIAPFIQMSRRPGIGASARGSWPTYGPLTAEGWKILSQQRNSWRAFALLNGTKIQVPRYYNTAWKQVATAEDREILDYERWQQSLTRDNSQKAIDDAEIIAEAKQHLHAGKRRYA